MDGHWALLQSERLEVDPSPELRRQLVARAWMVRELSRGHPHLQRIARGEAQPSSPGERAFAVLCRAHEHTQQEWHAAWTAMALVLRHRAL